MQKYCEQCRARYSFNPLTDFDHEHKSYGGNATLDNHDLPRLGAYTDDDGNTISVLRPLEQGGVNKLWGTRAALEGAFVPAVNSRGASKRLIRTHRRVMLEEV